MLTFDLKEVPDLIFCADCKHHSDKGQCALVGASMSFARRMKSVCGADAKLFQSKDDDKEG